MARINIEDSIFTDKRFIRFMMALQDECTAIGAFMFACLEAQKYHSLENIRALIPAKDFSEKVSYAAELLSTGVARLEDDHVYIIGAEEQFSWLTDAKTKGKKGGTKTRENRAERLQTEQNEESSPATDKSSPATAQLQPDIAQLPAATAESSPAYPLYPTLPLTLTLPLALTPKERGSKKQKVPKKDAPSGVDTNALVTSYCDSWALRYGSRPPITGKAVGLLARLLDDFPLSEAKSFVTAYLEMTDTWFLTKRHDLESLLANLNKVANYRATGRQVTTKEIRNFEDETAANNLREQILRGEV